MWKRSTRDPDGAALLQQQAEVCRRFNTTVSPVERDSVSGAARDVGSGLVPLNGLRHPAPAGTSGWYLWAGEEWSDEDDFFEPVHTDHLLTRAPEVLPYLGLPPGWRFLVTPGHEDVWFDESLLVVD